MDPIGYEDFKNFLSQLLMPGWHLPGGPVTLHPEIEVEELKGAVFFHNARTFLTALEESGGTAVTSGGNLNREFVRLMFDRMELPERVREDIRMLFKAINEEVVWKLHICRVVCECGKLITKRKKRFVITPRGRKLLQEPPGALYRALFLAFFDKFDLRYYSQFGNVPELQSTFPAVLWRLPHLYTDWAAVAGIAEKVLLPEIEAQVRKSASAVFSADWLVCRHFFEPLAEFGLIERKKGKSVFGIGEEDTIRLTPLFHHFIEFNFANRVHLN